VKEGVSVCLRQVEHERINGAAVLRPTKKEEKKSHENKIRPKVRDHDPSRD